MANSEENPLALSTDNSLALAEPHHEKPHRQSLFSYGDRMVVMCGYLFIVASVLSFIFMGYLKFKGDGAGLTPTYSSWLQLMSREVSTLTLFLIGIVTALLGQRLLNTAQMAYTRTIPADDLPLVSDAVKQGKPEPIDQYVRLRSLSGWAGNFTKLGITGLPLTTVFLTLVFSFISLFPIAPAGSFLDLAKLTLGAFIGSFVQRQVEQRRQDVTQMTGTAPRPSLPA